MVVTPIQLIMPSVETGQVKMVNLNQTTNIDPASTSVSFRDIVKTSLSKANAMQLNAHEQSRKFAIGESNDLHEVMIALTEAKIGLEFGIAVRNKAIDAYQELSRMQV